MATLQVKGLDDDLYKALRSRAEMDNRSISQEVVMMIKDFLARSKPGSSDKSNALLELAGSWEDDKSPSAAVKDLRKARINRKKRSGAGDVFA